MEYRCNEGMHKDLTGLASNLSIEVCCVMNAHVGTESSGSKTTSASIESIKLVYIYIYIQASFVSKFVQLIVTLLRKTIAA